MRALLTNNFIYLYVIDRSLEGNQNRCSGHTCQEMTMEICVKGLLGAFRKVIPVNLG